MAEAADASIFCRHIILSTTRSCDWSDVKKNSQLSAEQSEAELTPTATKPDAKSRRCYEWGWSRTSESIPGDQLRDPSQYTNLSVVRPKHLHYYLAIINGTSVAKQFMSWQTILRAAAHTIYEHSPHPFMR